MPEEITVKVPNKLAEFIDKLTEQGYFKSRNDFARCSMEMIAQLYGLAKTSKGGKSLLDVLTDNSKVSTINDTKKKDASLSEKSYPITTAVKTKALNAQEYDILDLFAGGTFEFEDALHAKYTMELMKQAKAPIPKDQFIELLKGLAAKGKIEQAEHSNKIIWKIIDKY